MSNAGMAGFEASMPGYCELRDLVALGNHVIARPYHPVVLDLLGQVMPDQTAAMSTIDGFRAIFCGHLKTLRAGRLLAPGDFDDLMRFAYRTFHPYMIALAKRMAKAGTAYHAARDAAAVTARDWALRARADRRDRPDGSAHLAQRPGRSGPRRPCGPCVRGDRAGDQIALRADGGREHRARGERPRHACQRPRDVGA